MCPLSGGERVGVRERGKHILCKREAVKQMFDSLAVFLQVHFFGESMRVAKGKRNFMPGGKQNG